MAELGDKIMVCIHCMTYNHEKYLADALEGFIMQKTDFPFVAVVIDDCSTDGTADVLREYEKKYPDIIKAVYLQENYYSQHKTKQPFLEPWDSKAKYIALCEGDDYWTDPLKLQKQVEFLEEHYDIGLCYTSCDIYTESSRNWRRNIINPNIKLIDETNPIACEDYCANMTWVYRHHLFQSIPSNPGYIDGALYLLYNFCLISKLGEIKDVTGVYRRHIGSASCFSGSDRDKEYLYNRSNFLLQINFIPRFKDSLKNYKRIYTTNLFDLFITAKTKDDVEIIKYFEDFFQNELSLNIFEKWVQQESKKLKYAQSAQRSRAYRLGKIIIYPFAKIKNAIISYHQNNQLNLSEHKKTL